jgi:hypothetical protein
VAIALAVLLGLSGGVDGVAVELDERQSTASSRVQQAMEPVLDRAGSEPQLEELCPRDDAVLGRSQACDPHIGSSVRFALYLRDK